MPFTNPLFLWGLLLLPAPVVIHLFFRRRKTRVDYSTIQFFRPHQRSLAHRRRLREVLLLGLRTLALLLLVLALARPVVRHLAWDAAGRTDCVIVLDDTLSMQRRSGGGSTVFSVARAAAVEIVETLRPGDGVAVVRVSGRSPMPLQRSLPAVADALREASVTGASGSLAAALAQAAGLLGRSGSPNREIVLISDLQTTQLPDRPDVVANLGAIRCFAVPLRGSGENCAVTEVSLSGRPKVAGQAMPVSATVVNFGRRTRELEIALEIRGERVGSRRAVLAPDGVWRGTFGHVPEAPGLLTGAVVIDDGGMVLDDRRYFCAEVRAGVRILLVRGDLYSRADPYFFLSRCLAPAGNVALNGYELEEAYAEELTRELVRDRAVVVLANPAPLTRAVAAVLEHYLREGGTVVSFAGPRVTTETLAPLEMAPLRGLYGDKAAVDVRGIRFHGALAALNQVLKRDLICWRRRNPLRPGPQATVLAEVDGTPMVVMQQVGSGRWIALGCSARRDYSNWPELNAFPVAMIHLFDIAAREPRPMARVVCGRSLSTAASAPEVVVADLAGNAVRVASAGGRVALNHGWIPTVWTIQGSALKAAVVDPDPAESDPAAPPPDDALRRLGPVRFHRLAADRPIAEQVRDHRRGNALTGPLLLAVLAVLGAEAVVAYRFRFGVRRASAGAGAAGAASA